MLEIKEVSNNKDLKDYHNFIESLYKTEPFYRTPYEIETENDHKIMVYDGDTIYGAMSFTIDVHLLRSEGVKNILVHECAWSDRLDVARLACEYIQSYGQDNNCNAIVIYPVILTEGFNQHNCVKGAYNSLYYPLIFEELGFQKKDSGKGYSLTPKNFFGKHIETKITPFKGEKGEKYEEIVIDDQKTILYEDDNYLEIMEDHITNREALNQNLIQLLKEKKISSIILYDEKTPLNKLKKAYPLFNIAVSYKFVKMSWTL